jgi:phage gp37-like protein
MTSPVRQVEQAMLARLRAVPRSYAGLLIESYAAQLDDEMYGWIRSLPAVWVTFGQAQEIRRTGARSFLVGVTFEVVCAQRALLENDGRLNPASSGATVGVYELLEDNKLALANQTLGLQIQPVTPGAIRPLMKSLVNRDAVAVYAQEFKTQWIETLPEAALEPDGTLVTVGLNYLIKPGDELVDSTDTVTTKVT